MMIEIQSDSEKRGWRGVARNFIGPLAAKISSATAARMQTPEEIRKWMTGD
jgi:hypothetical protein